MILLATGTSLTPFHKPLPHRRMPLPASFNRPQQPLQHDGSSSEFHDPLSDLYGSRQISTLSISQHAQPNAANPAHPEHPLPLDLSVHPDFNPRGWKHLINGSLATHERASMIATIFSNRKEIDEIRNLCGDDAQTIVNVIYEVCPYTLLHLWRASPLTLAQTFTSIRYWMTSITCYGCSVCASCAKFVAIKPCFRNRSISSSLITEPNHHWAMVGFRMCGRVHLSIGRLQSRF